MSTPHLARLEAGATVGEPRDTSLRWALAGLSLSMLLSSLGTSIANVALPSLAQALGASFAQVQWIVLAYLLAITTLIVSVGRLGDVMGRRWLLRVGIGLYTGASVLCGVASTLWLLIAARALQGLGAATMMALTLAFVVELVPKAKAGSAMGLLGTMSAVGTALGPALGGLLIAVFGWPAVFLAPVPLSLLAMLLVHRYLPADRSPAMPKLAGFDLTGTVLLAGTLAAYALAMTTGRGHFGWLNVALLGAAAVGLGLFVRTELRAAAPLIRLVRLRDPGLRSGLALSALVSTVLMAMQVVGPFYLAYALGLGATQVGLVLSVAPVIAALAGVPSGRLVDRLGSSRLTWIGLAGIAIGCVGLGAAPASLGAAGYVLASGLTTACYALFQAANNTAVMNDVSADQRGVVSGLLSLSRNLGLVTGAAVMGAVFAAATGVSDFNNAGAGAVATGMRVTFGVAAGLVAGTLLAVFGSRARAARK
jgi:MFS family permease